MVGMNVPNTRLERFSDAINRGELLVMADVPRERLEELESRISQRVPVFTWRASIR